MKDIFKAIDDRYGDLSTLKMAMYEDEDTVFMNLSIDLDGKYTEEMIIAVCEYAGKTTVRVATCKHTGKEIVQEKFGNEWVCMHSDTEEEDLKKIKKQLKL